MRRHASIRRSTIAGLVCLCAAACVPALAAAAPIPSTGPASPLTAFTGAPATPNPITGIAQPPRHPFMAPNGRSNIHDDTWQTNTYTTPGPLGRAPQLVSSALGSICGSITFDSRGRIVAVCTNLTTTQLQLIDPRTLATLATYELPPKPAPTPNSNPFQNFTGGGYFYLDQKDEAVVPTTTRHIVVIGETPDGTGFVLLHDYDVSKGLRPQELITSALPDFAGNIWFVTKVGGVVGVLNTRTGRVRLHRTGEETENSFAVDPAGVYIPTIKAMYGYVLGPHGEPRAQWRVLYPNSGIHKPGQVDAGTGTTPSLMTNGDVAITDNADPMDIVVYRRAMHIRGSRMVCRQAVFSKGASDTENSLIVAGRAMVVENNYGYVNPDAVAGGKTSTPGFARVDVRPDNRGCRLVWTNAQISGPTVVPKLSLANGLIYAYTKPADASGADPWYWTALDFRSGAVVWQQQSGRGSFNYNNNYSGIVLGPDGTAYLGVLDGIIAVRDGP
jgi:hypothetical protein